MGRELDEFRRHATSGQIVVLDRILELGDQEAEAEREYKKVAGKYNDEVDAMRSQWGFSFRQISDLVVDQEIFPRYRRELERTEARFWAIRAEIAGLLVHAVEKHGMGQLGLVQRHYESYVGEPLEQAA